MGKFDGWTMVTDLDGTFTREKEICGENREYVKYFQENGGVFTVATGRLRHYIDEFSDFMPNAPVISHNGAVVYDRRSDRVLYKSPLKVSVSEVNDFIMSFDSCASVSMHDLDHSRLYGVDETPADNCWYKGVAWGFTDAEKATLLRNALAQKYGSVCEVFKSWNTGVEYLDFGVNKGRALTELKKHLGSAAKYTVAFGDEENDAKMLQSADFGFTVENGSEAAKKAACETLPHYTTGVIALVIKRLDEGLDSAGTPKDGFCLVHKAEEA